MDVISIVGIVLIVVAALILKKVVGFLFRTLIFLVLLAGVYFFLGPQFRICEDGALSRTLYFFNLILLLLQCPHLCVMRIGSQ